MRLGKFVGTLKEKVVPQGSFYYIDKKKRPGALFSETVLFSEALFDALPVQAHV